MAEAGRHLDAGEIWRGEVEFDHPESGPIICQVTAVPIPDTGDGRPAFLWILEDQTEIRQLQRQAIVREQLALKGEMAGEIAHELNNYLAVLMGNTELLPLYLGEQMPPGASRALDNISKALAQINLFTDSLLRSRHPSGQRVEIHLNEFLRNQIAFLHPQKRLKKIVIETKWDEAMPPLVCDASGLQQAFYNLLLNAADALAVAETGKYTVYVSTQFNPEALTVQLAIADDGRGLSPDIIPRLFRERISSKPDGHGFGMLTIARFVQEHGGTITAGNRAGGGALFTMTLPLSATGS
jgi:signal transduction histidine kinase